MAAQPAAHGRRRVAAVAAAPAGGAAPPGAQREREAGDKVAVELARQGANLTLSFSFLAPTAAAVFQRADSLWIVFDSKAAIDLSALDGEASRTIRGAIFTHAPDADIVRIRLDRPHLAGVISEGPVWTVIVGDSVPDPTHALEIDRNMIGPNRSSVTIPFQEPHQLHRIDDADVGDQLFVVTAFAPARGFINAQDFVEFRALASTQGVVVEPLADDVNVELAPDKVVISRPGGLTLSSSLQRVLRGNALRPVTFNSQLWGLDQQATYTERQSVLVAAAASAPASKRLPTRLDLARFYIARDMYPEAKGVLDVALTEDRPPEEQVSANVLRAVAEVMMNRPDDALQGSCEPQRRRPARRAAVAGARLCAPGQMGAGARPLQERRSRDRDAAGRAAARHASRRRCAPRSKPAISPAPPTSSTTSRPSACRGRCSRGFPCSSAGWPRASATARMRSRPIGRRRIPGIVRAAAQGRLREIALRYTLGDLKRKDVITELESLTTVWRGDDTEIEALKILARLYTEEGRYRDAFYVMRSAMSVHPNWDMTRRIQEEAATTFEALFLSGKGDTLPAIDALALFYDFRELTPIGRRGDEMIRRLADRLVSVDLLDQAAELLQYQVDHRLQGAARAQVATRLAVIYLMNHKADRALATLQATRTAEVSTELRNQRLLLEARALSDIGRHDLALEVAIACRRPRGDPAALRYPVDGATLARVGRADRASLRRSLEGLAAAERCRTRRHLARRDRLCARRRRARARPLPREIRGEDGANGGPRAPSRWSPPRSAPPERNSATSPTPRRRSTRSKHSCATCRRVIRTRAPFRRNRGRRRRQQPRPPRQDLLQPRLPSSHGSCRPSLLQPKLLRTGAQDGRHPPPRQPAHPAHPRPRRGECRSACRIAPRSADLLFLAACESPGSGSRGFMIVWQLTNMIRKKCKALFRSDHAPLVVPEDRQQDDDWQRDAQQPKQQSASESHDESPQR